MGGEYYEKKDELILSKKIVIAGAGYVGLSLAVLLEQHNHVTIVDILPEKVDMINNRISPIRDVEIEQYLQERPLNLTATLDGVNAYKEADFVIIAAPTNYDSQMNFFDTSAVESVIELVTKNNPNAMIVIKCTIPVGYTASIRKKTGNKNIIFSPEFCVSLKRCMIIFILHASSFPVIRKPKSRRTSLLIFYSRVQLKRI